MKEKVVGIVRIASLAILTINSILTAKGINPIPFDEALVTECAVYIANGIAAFWAWWKNNNMTKEAQAAQVLKNNMKIDGIPDVYYDPEAIVQDEYIVGDEII